MRPSYRQMIDEHEMIEAAADVLLGNIRDDRADASTLAAELLDLARVIEEHIAVETELTSGVDETRLTGPWIAAWEDGRSTFERLRRDWIAFLYHWNAPAIERDRQGFQASAEIILGRLRERLLLETQAFYATALQIGAIDLR